MVLTAWSFASRPPGRTWFGHAYLIVLENHEYGDIVGNPDAPYLNQLIRGYGLETNYHALAHPSGPNYLALVTGSTQGVTDDGVHDITAPSLFDQLDAAGLSWHVYAQDYPGSCFAGESASGPDDGGPAGEYVRRHNPAISLDTVRMNPARCARITGLASFTPGAAAFSMIALNNTTNMHDGTVRQADDFLAALVPHILGDPSFADGALFITWDEGTTSDGGGGHVPMIVVRPGMRPGTQDAALRTHRSFVRTIEDGFGLPCLPATCGSTSMAPLFGR